MAPGEFADENLCATLRSVCREHPVRTAFLFGSRVTRETHRRSDVDVAVVFDDLSPGEPEYNDALFGLSADLAAALCTDDVDVVDLEQAPASLARSILEEGERLLGDESAVSRLRSELESEDGGERSPRERFDDLLSDIDEHLA